MQIKRGDEIAVSVLEIKRDTDRAFNSRHVLSVYNAFTRYVRDYDLQLRLSYDDDDDADDDLKHVFLG